MIGADQGLAAAAHRQGFTEAVFGLPTRADAWGADLAPDYLRGRRDGAARRNDDALPAWQDRRRN